MKFRRALIIGISGQDGSFLARFLLSKGYKVWGSSRDAQGGSFNNLNLLGIKAEICLISIDPEDFRSVLLGLKNSRAEEVYFLAGQSSVRLSFELPAETIQSHTFGLLNILEAVRFLNTPIKIFNAGSSEIYGDTQGKAADESTPFRPKSPYGLAKASTYWLAANYRDAYGLFVCTGILFNHESPFRPAHYVTQKIIQSAKRIASGSKEKLVLGRLDICRDWGWAPEYVEVMWMMLQLQSPEDMLIATGESYSLESFIETVFAKLGMDWRKHVVQDSKLYRPSDLELSKASPKKAYQTLGWKAKYRMNDVIQMMLKNEFN
ncbi:GDP-mannose 4,6-dehydratase [uncultured Algoriphagus sp.]|uniref:GDP-mannose 4,6-dehydratase n=1 Tax=uncultured Algoriphagus sp. TaxID=417365 RepID=UPI0025924375|nr:GDP-mannose 4,6-dehydratase [uncultured Algoriphagus sp.]